VAHSPTAVVDVAAGHHEIHSSGRGDAGGGVAGGVINEYEQAA
jgi:hypothetical protein